MIVLSAFVPYPPYSPDKENGISTTLEAYKKIEEELYAAQPEVIIFIGKHDDLLADAFSGTTNEILKTSFGLYGDFETSITIKGAIKFIQEISEETQAGLPFVQFTEEVLPYSISVASYLLTSKLKNVQIAPLYYSMHNNDEHVKFGITLREVIENSNKRVAVIAVGNLSHCINSTGPLKNKKGQEFDDQIMEALKTGSTESLPFMNEKMVKKAKECGLKQLLILMGVLQDTAYDTEVLSYEHPYGVGYLTALFRMHDSK